MSKPQILCPVDFSPSSTAAFRHAVDLAIAKQATLLLVHVSPPPPLFVSGYVGAGPIPTHYPQPDSRLEDIKDDRVEIQYADLVGFEGEAIVKYADQHDCDSIVMGSHGYSPFQRFLFGSVAEFVLRHARCPVIVVRDPADSHVEMNGEPAGAD